MGVRNACSVATHPASSSVCTDAPHSPRAVLTISWSPPPQPRLLPAFRTQAVRQSPDLRYRPLPRADSQLSWDSGGSPEKAGCIQRVGAPTPCSLLLVPSLKGGLCGHHAGASALPLSPGRTKPSFLESLIAALSAVLGRGGSLLGPHGRHWVGQEGWAGVRRDPAGPSGRPCCASLAGPG